jgi:hypothetical protein
MSTTSDSSGMLKSVAIFCCGRGYRVLYCCENTAICVGGPVWGSSSPMGTKRAS